MTIQLRSQGIADGRLKYHADGKLLVDDMGTEILLSEVSSSFDENSKGKTSFDHHKAMFGLLTMVRTIAGLFKYSSFETFSKLKLHLIHTHDCAIRHWTMSTPAPGLYVLSKEQRVDIINESKKKKNSTVPFVNFNFTLASALEETMSILGNLKNEHGEKLQSLRFEPNTTHPSLLDHVRPQVVRLNENKHMAQVADDSPKSPVYIPNT
ncbi:hypothetical protein BDC45DRAFT_538414 [Circinella umbellata]|nr:hypothetical protein BDC45DRAFT_538414 [Circinella umbellata]